MDSLELCLAIARLTDYDFAFVKNTHIYNLENNERIDINNFKLNNYPDGIYRLTSNTCDGKCVIGTPKKDCVDRGIVGKYCAKYHLVSLDNFSFLVSFNDLKSILSGN